MRRMQIRAALVMFTLAALMASRRSHDTHTRTIRTTFPNLNTKTNERRLFFFYVRGMTTPTIFLLFFLFFSKLCCRGWAGGNVRMFDKR